MIYYFSRIGDSYFSIIYRDWWPWLVAGAFNFEAFVTIYESKGACLHNPLVSSP